MTTTTTHLAADGEYSVNDRPAGGVDLIKVRRKPGSGPRRMEIGETLYFPTREQAVQWIDRWQPRFQQFDDEDWMMIHSVDHLDLDEQVDGYSWFVECPNRFRVYFRDLEQANDWCRAQWLGDRFPDEMSEGDIHDCGPGFHWDFSR